MNRRDFFGSLALGSLAAVAVVVIVDSLKASPVRKKELPFPTGRGPIEWSIREKNQRIVYRFHKGPDYTNLEEAFPYMQEIVGAMRDDNVTFTHNVVMLESVGLEQF